MTSQSSSSILGLFRRFPKVFWVAQSFELMERGAYYLMMPILVLHAINNVGVPEAWALVLTMFMYPFQYGIPILSGALAEKIGYRRQIIFAFSVLTLAYFFLSMASNLIMMIAGVMLIGFGIGSYKPLISATVAKSTPSKDRNVAYAIYYWTVNLAASVFPIIWVVLLLLGYVDATMYAWVFRVGSIFMIVNVFTAILIFKEVPRTGEVKTVMDAVRNVRTAFKDRKFVVMALLIAGFWALYSSMLNVLPVALINFDLPIPSWVGADGMVIGIWNPLTIILLGIPLSKFLDKLQSLKAIMGGVFLYLVGLGVIVFFLSNFYIVVLGIVISSIGEFMVAPGYLSFVSKLAPKEKVSAYIGSNFLASFLGLAGGTLINGLMFSYIGIDLGRPRLFYGLLIAFGLLLIVAFITYYKSWGHEILERARKIKEREEGLDESDLIKEHPTGMRRLFNVVDLPAIRLVPLLLIPVVIVGTFALGTNVYTKPTEDQVKETGVQWQTDVEIRLFDGYTNERQETSTELIPLGEPLWINVSFAWDDEPAVRLTQNQPDSFAVDLFAPNQTAAADGGTGTSTSGSGSISFNFNVASSGIVDKNGTWVLSVGCTDAGDVLGPFGVIVRDQDNGNDWSMTVSITYRYQVENKD